MSSSIQTPTRTDGSADLDVLASESEGDADRVWMTTEAARRHRRGLVGRRRPHEFDPKPYAPSSLARARRLWTIRATAEHESALIFAGLMPFAVEARIGLEAELVIAGMAEDEMRHAVICTDVVHALAGEPPKSPVPPLIPRSTRPIEEQLLRHVIFGNCLTETVNTARLVDASGKASDPFMREALLALLTDEVRHAKFGFVLLANWKPWLEAHPETVRALDAFLPGAFATLERILSGVGAPRDDFGDDDLALGSPDPGRLAEVFYRTVEEAVVPGLDRLGLAASSAWKARSRSAHP